MAENTAVTKEYWGNQLSSYEYKIYSTIHEYAVNGGKGEMKVEFVYDGIWDHGEAWLQEKVSDMVARAESAFCFDYPLYWCKNFDYSMEATGNHIVIYLQATPYYDFFWEELPEVQEQIHLLEDDIREKGHEEDSFLLVEDIYIAVADSLTYSFRTDEICQDAEYDDGIVHTIAAATLDGYHHMGVCSSYSGLFQILCQNFGIPCIQVTNKPGEWEAHSFNLVQLENAWYLVDVTWGDQGDNLDWRYFLAGSKIAMKEHALGDQLACSKVQTPFENVELADAYFYTWKEGDISFELPEHVVYDGNDPNAKSTFVCQVTCEPASRAVAETVEYLFQKGHVVDDSVPGQVVLDVTHTGFVTVKVVPRYVEDTLEQKFYVKSYPEFEPTDTGYLVRCKQKQFMTKGILAESAEYYDITTEDAAYTVSFAKNTLEHMAAENVFDFSVALFTGFGEKDYVEGIREEQEAENITHKAFIQKILQKQIRKEEKKYAKGPMIFGLAFAQYDTLYQEGVLTYQLPEKCKEWYGKTLQGITIEQNGAVVDCGSYAISEDGQITILAPYEAMFFYEEAWKTSEEYYRPFLMMGAVLVILLFAGLLGVRFRKRNHIDEDGVEW